MKWVNATLGFMEHPPAIVISPDKSHIEGLLYARVFNALYDDAKVSLILESIHDDFGHCTNGTNHTGILKDLNELKYDFSYLNLDQINCGDLLNIEIGPVFQVFQQAMASMKRPPKPDMELTSDFTDIFKSVSIEIYFLFVFVFLFVMFLWIKVSKSDPNVSKESHVGWDMFSITLSQYNGNPSKTLFRLIVLSYFMIIFWLFQYLFASFTSDLSISRPTPSIDSLADLAVSKNYTAMFIAEHDTWRSFKYTSDPIKKKIWKKAMAKWKDESLIANHLSKGPVTAYLMCKDDHRVGITVRSVIRFMILIHCGSYDEKESQPILHEAFDESLPAARGVIAFGPSVSAEAKERIIWATSLFFERGLSDYYDKNPQGILNLPFDQQRACLLNLEAGKQFQEQAENPRALKPSNFRSFTWICSTFIILGVCVLIYEREKGRNISNFSGNIFFKRIIIQNTSS